MRPGAHTPEELETLLEDAFVTRDRAALAALFEAGAVLVAGDGVPEARGREAIGRLAAALWARDRTYVADPQRVLQARDTALVVAERGLAVVRRGADGAWRYAIALLRLDAPDDASRKGTKMPTLRIEHQISDFDTWKQAFDRDPVGRQRSGVRRYRVLRPVGDPNYVLIDLDFDSTGEAEACLAALQRDVWGSGRAAPALLGRPQARIVEAVESKEY